MDASPRLVLQRLASLALRLARWRVVGVMPRAPKLVTIVAPHTSNWDFLVGLACGYGSGLLSAWPYGFLAKQSLFRWPLGLLLRALGGIPVDRTAPNAVVDQMAAFFAGRERFLLAITPEGTRKRTEFWRAGFYRIARAAGVPIMPVAFDYGRRECRFGEVLVPTGDVKADLAALRAFYAGVTPKHPAAAGEIRFRE
ncbi:MAG: 1-acyl-sn-glycerol-3-phosphate acyltransferase [Gemmatimonadales bacterium]